MLIQAIRVRALGGERKSSLSRKVTNQLQIIQVEGFFFVPPVLEKI